MAGRDSERKLEQLVEIGASHNLEGIREFKKQGGRVVGLLAAHIPEEILYAAGILPWHIIGTQRESTPLAGVHRSPATDAYCTHVLEALLSGELDFLDGIIATNYDDDTKACEYFSRYYSKPAFVYWLEIPVNARELNIQHYAENLMGMKTAIEQRFNAKISDEKLGDAIRTYNTTRKLLHRLYDMRKKDKPPLTGSEVWGVVSAAMATLQSDFIYQLESLIPYIEKRQLNYINGQPRILLSSDFLHNVGYIRLIEDSGGLVAMDDSDVGARYFWYLVSEEGNNPLHALAERYLDPRVSSPRFAHWDYQVEQVIEWAKEFRIDGIIEMPVLQSLPRLFRSEYFHRTLEEDNFPRTNIQREYHLANVAQVTTRVEAFLEMLGQRNRA